MCALTSSRVVPASFRVWKGRRVCPLRYVNPRLVVNRFVIPPSPNACFYLPNWLPHHSPFGIYTRYPTDFDNNLHHITNSHPHLKMKRMECDHKAARLRRSNSQQAQQRILLSAWFGSRGTWGFNGGGIPNLGRLVRLNGSYANPCVWSTMSMTFTIRHFTPKWPPSLDV